jgi:hypothetical protein
MALRGSDAIVIGSPGLMTSWGFGFIQALQAQYNNPFRICPVRVQTDIAKFRSDNRDDKRLLFIAQFPSESLIATISSHNLPIILFVDDAVDAAAYIRRVADTPIRQCITVLAAANVANFTLGQRDTVLRAHRRFGGSADNLMRLIIHQLGLEMKPDALRALRDRFLPDPNNNSIEGMLSRCCEYYAESGVVADVLSDEDVTMIGHMIEPMVRVISNGEIAPIVWPHNIFYSGDTPNQEAPLVSDVMGRARIIYYGPYLQLPQGRYDVRFVLGVSNDIGTLPLTIEAVWGEHGANVIAKAYMTARKGGVFYGRFKMRHTEPQRAVEIRLRSDEGAIEGKIALAQIEFLWHEL